MRSWKGYFNLSIAGFFILATACSHNSGGGGPPPNPVLSVPGYNVLVIQVGGPSVCGVSAYENEPCTSVEICVPGTNTCQTIPNILVDTGSVGLRIFSQAVNFASSFPQVSDTKGNPIGECAEFGTGADWGPVRTADVIIGGEPTIKNLPIHILDVTFGSVPSTCTSPNPNNPQQPYGPDQGPTNAGYNGILGVGLFTEDCGPGCASKVNNQTYYSCSSGNCSATTLATSLQVQNPVSHLAAGSSGVADNNGVIVELPPLPSTYAGMATGALVLGIGTSSNNIPSGVTVYPADNVGNFTVQFNGQNYSGTSFIDSGSNGIFFPQAAVPSLPECSSSGPASGFYCPSSNESFSAVSVGNGGSPVSAPVAFQITNGAATFSSNFFVFNNLGGTADDGFDWGLPFFFGRKVYVGIDTMTSSIGTGPFWAY